MNYFSIFYKKIKCVIVDKFLGYGRNKNARYLYCTLIRVHD